MSERGGIGIGFGPVAEEAQQVERRVPRYNNGEAQGNDEPPRPASERQMLPERNMEDRAVDLEEALEMMRAASAENGQVLQQFLDRLTESDERLAQLEGQVARLELTLQTTITQVNNGFTTAFARVEALAAQVLRNQAFGALQLATTSRNPGEQADTVVKNAEKYETFLLKPRGAPAPVAPPATSEEPAGAIGDPKAPTQH